MNISKLINQKALKQQALIDKAKAEDRALTEDELKEFEELQKEIENLKKQQKMEEQLEKTKQFLDEPAEKTIIPTDTSVQGDVKDDHGFKNLGEFVKAVRFGDEKGRLKDMAVSTGDSGGIQVPERFVDDLKKFAAEDSIVRPRAQVFEPGTPPDSKITIPAFQQGSEGALGGVHVAWTDEGKEIADAGSGKIKEISLEPHEVSGYTTVTDKLLRNWQSCNTFITNLLRGAITAAEDYKFILGSGVGCPLGFLKTPGALKIDRNTTGTVKFIDIVNMMAVLPGEAMDNALFIASRTLLPDIVTMTDGAGNLVYVQGNVTKKIPDTLLGIPVKWVGKVSTKGKEGDISLVDLRYYLIKDGSGPFVAASEHVLFKQNKTIIKVVWNTDGQSWVTEPLTLDDKETKVSPFIILKQ